MTLPSWRLQLASSLVVLQLVGAHLLCVNAGYHLPPGPDPGVVYSSIGPVLWQERVLGGGGEMASVNMPEGKRGSINMQDDCNLVVYDLTGFHMWASHTQNKGTDCYLKMQTDGNLVVYDGNNAPMWSSQTDGKGEGPYYLIFQEDNNAVVYGKNHEPIWASGTVWPPPVPTP